MKLSLLKLLNPNLLVLRQFGLIPPPQLTIQHFLRLSLLFIIPVFGYLSMLTIAVLHVDSVESKVNNSVVWFSVFNCLARGLVFYRYHSEILKILDSMSALEGFENGGQCEQKIIKSVYKFGKILFLFICTSYACSGALWIAQGIFMGSGAPTWSSSEIYPDAMSRNKNIFSFVLAIQVLGCIVVVSLVAIYDSFSIIANIIFGVYVDILGQNLCKTGYDEYRFSQSARVRLKECIEMHLVCLR